MRVADPLYIICIARDSLCKPGLHHVEYVVACQIPPGSPRLTLATATPDYCMCPSIERKMSLTCPLQTRFSMWLKMPPTSRFELRIRGQELESPVRNATLY